MDITEKVMYLDYLTESKDTKKEESENAVSFELVSLKNNNVDKIIDQAMKACTNRANELAK